MDAVFRPGTGWTYEGCSTCRTSARKNLIISEGTSLRFHRVDDTRLGKHVNLEAGYSLIEITAEISARSRYIGSMLRVPEEDCVVAVFKDLVTGAFYGQPV